MFYRGLKSGVILYRKTRNGIDISKIKDYYKVDFSRVYVLYPIIGNWIAETVIHTENTKRSRWKRSCDGTCWYCWGTNFNKVYETDVV